MADDYANYLRTWQKKGWVVTKTGGGHIRLSHEDALMPVFCASTPSDHRAIRNIETQMRRALGIRTEEKINIASPKKIFKTITKSRAKKAAPKFFMRFIPQETETPNENDISLFDQTNKKLRADVWRLCYLRLRFENRERSTIRVLQKRFKTDDEYFRTALMNFEKNGILETSRLRALLRDRGKVVVQPMPVVSKPRRRRIMSRIVKNGSKQYS